MVVGCITGCFRATATVMVHRTLRRRLAGVAVFAIRTHPRRSQQQREALCGHDYRREDNEMTTKRGEHASGS